MEDDDAEMADNGTDDADDHVPMAPAFLLYLEKHKRLGTLKFRSEVPDSRTFTTVAAEVLALSIAVGDCTTIVQSRSKLSGPFIVILTAVLKSQLDHENPELLVRVIDVDEPGTGRNPRTLMRRFDVAARVTDSICACV